MSKQKRPERKLSDAVAEQSEFHTSAERDVTLSKLTAQLSTLRTRHANAVAEIEKLEAQLAAFTQLGDAPLAPKRPRKTKIHKSTGLAACVVLNDWHCGETIDPGSIEYDNAHNEHIFAQRCDNACAKAELLYNLLLGFGKVDEIHVLVLGDLMSNYLHEELMETNWCGPTEEMLEIRSRLAGFIDRFQETTGVTNFHVHTCHGNHGRLTRRRRFKAQNKTNLEWQVYEDLARRYAEAKSPVQWNVSKTNFNRASVKGWLVRMHHGDDIRFEGGIGGLSIPLIKAVKQWDQNKRADYTVLGHWHQFLRLWNIVVCGCQCGYDEYAQGHKFAAQPPTQTFLAFDDKMGLILAEPLFVE